MARHLVRLKVALLRGTLTTVGLRGKVAFGITYLFAMGFGVLGAIGLLELRTVSDTDFQTLVSLVFGLLFLGWTFLPVLTIAVENTLDVDRLALFPLGPRELMPGLLLASMVGFGGLFTAVLLVGALAGSAPVGVGAVVTVCAVVLLFGVCVAASRVVSTALSAATRKRRWRDVALTAVPLVYFAINIAVRVYTPSKGAGRTFARVLELLPSGPAVIAVVGAREGRWLAAVAGVLVEALVLVVLLRLWWAAIARVLTTATESSGPATSAVAGGLYPRWVRWLPASRAGAVAAKELRLQWREPRRRAQLMSAGFFALLPLFSLRASQEGLGHAAVLIAAFPAMIFGIAALNQYAFDGPRFWTHVAAGDDARADLLGKNIETALVALPIATVVAVAVAAVSGGWVFVVPVIVLAAAAIGVQLGIGNVTSVVMPVAMPDSGTSAWANNTAQGMQVIVPALLGLLVTTVVIGPFVALTGYLAGRPVIVLVMAAEAALGWGAWRLGLRIAVRRSAGRQPELLAQLSRMRGT